ncbi:MAG: hypothetical protein U0944_02200 [Candidatus Moranbacteria bacterium]|nr:hypothetical protein [Candidatus Moranbacteria bacterium]
MMSQEIKMMRPAGIEAAEGDGGLFGRIRKKIDPNNFRNNPELLLKAFRLELQLVDLHDKPIGDDEKKASIEEFQASDEMQDFLEAAVGANSDAADGFPREGNMDGGSQKELERLEAAGLFQDLEKSAPEASVADKMLPINVQIGKELESHGIKKYQDGNWAVESDMREEKNDISGLKDRLDVARRVYIAKRDTGQEKSSLLKRIFGFGADLGKFNAELQDAKSNYENALEVYKDAVAGASVVENGYDAGTMMRFLDKSEYLDLAGAQDDARLEAGGWLKKLESMAVENGSNFGKILIKYLREAGIYVIEAADGRENSIHPGAHIGSDADSGNVENIKESGYAAYPGMPRAETESAAVLPDEIPNAPEIPIAEVPPIEAAPAGNEFDFEINMFAQQYRETAKNVHSPEYAKTYSDNVIALLGGRGVLMGEIMDRNAQEYIRENTQSDTVQFLDSLRKSLAGDEVGLKELDPKADENMFDWSTRVAEVMRKRWSK